MRIKEKNPIKMNLSLGIMFYLVRMLEKIAANAYVKSVALNKYINKQNASAPLTFLLAAVPFSSVSLLNHFPSYFLE
jgi:hypothetical protein